MDTELFSRGAKGGMTTSFFLLLLLGILALDAKFPIVISFLLRERVILLLREQLEMLLALALWDAKFQMVISSLHHARSDAKCVMMNYFLRRAQERGTRY